MARNFNVQGTKEYLYWAIGLLLVSVWCAKDGWFPSESYLNKVNKETNEKYGFTLVELEKKYEVPLPEGFDPETAGDAAKKRYPPPSNVIFDMDNKNNFWRFNRMTAIGSIIVSLVLFGIHRAVS